LEIFCIPPSTDFISSASAKVASAFAWVNIWGVTSIPVTLAPFLLEVMAVLPVPQATSRTRFSEETSHNFTMGRNRKKKKVNVVVGSQTPDLWLRQERIETVILIV
jgi:hypothetical protein